MPIPYCRTVHRLFKMMLKITIIQLCGRGPSQHLTQEYIWAKSMSDTMCHSTLSTSIEHAYNGRSTWSVANMDPTWTQGKHSDFHPSRSFRWTFTNGTHGPCTLSAKTFFQRARLRALISHPSDTITWVPMVLNRIVHGLSTAMLESQNPWLHPSVS